MFTPTTREQHGGQRADHGRAAGGGGGDEEEEEEEHDPVRRERAQASEAMEQLRVRLDSVAGERDSWKRAAEAAEEELREEQRRVECLQVALLEARTRATHLVSRAAADAAAVAAEEALQETSRSAKEHLAVAERAARNLAAEEAARRASQRQLERARRHLLQLAAEFSSPPLQGEEEVGNGGESEDWYQCTGSKTMVRGLGQCSLQLAALVSTSHGLSAAPAHADEEDVETLRIAGRAIEALLNVARELQEPPQEFSFPYQT